MVWVENEEPFKETGVTMAKIADEAGKHGIAMWAGKPQYSRLHCTCMHARNFAVYGLCDTEYRELKFIYHVFQQRMEFFSSHCRYERRCRRLCKACPTPPSTKT
jgi:hypothetical protein